MTILFFYFIIFSIWEAMSQIGGTAVEIWEKESGIRIGIRTGNRIGRKIGRKIGNKIGDKDWE